VPTYDITFAIRGVGGVVTERVTAGNPYVARQIIVRRYQKGSDNPVTLFGYRVVPPGK
jgi:hypothetical protein